MRKSQMTTSSRRWGAAVAERTEAELSQFFNVGFRVSAGKTDKAAV